MSNDELRLRYEQVLERIADACGRAGRDPDEVTLVAVSKTFPIEAVVALQAMGQENFAENKVQELIDKSTDLPGLIQGGTARWHMVGHLQRNKARDVVARADVFHALDSPRLARELERRCAEAERRLPCMVQVNVSGEESKFGLPPKRVPSFLDELDAFPHLQVRGLMTLASPADNPEDVRPQFRLLRRLARSASSSREGERLDWLSMGMSGDFEVAVEEGATHVRIGSAIFGERSPH